LHTLTGDSTHRFAGRIGSFPRTVDSRPRPKRSRRALCRCMRSPPQAFSPPVWPMPGISGRARGPVEHFFREFTSSSPAPVPGEPGTGAGPGRRIPPAGAM